MTEYRHKIKHDDLPDELRYVADLIGMEALLRLIGGFGGSPLNLPTIGSIAKNARNRAICSEFNGKNYRELAVKYGLTVRWVRIILAKGGCIGKKQSSGQIQLSLF